jgi:AcrR family transcriptional regulator
MGIAERKEKQKTEIRKLILDASMKLFVEEGFDSITIRRIAEIIEYSPTTVYLYFKDKDEIFYGLHDIGFEKLQEFNDNLASIQNPLIRLHKMGENYLRFGMENPEYYSLMFINGEPMKTMTQLGCEGWKPGDAAIARLQATIAECMEKGYLAKADPYQVSLAVWSFVHGLVALAIRQRLEKFVTDEKMILPTMEQALNWFMNNIDITERKRPE